MAESGTQSRARLQITNVKEQETVHQRCLLVTGTCQDYSDVEDFVAVRVRDGFNQLLTQQNWPVHKGAFKCLVMLRAGSNRTDFELHHKGEIYGSERVTLQYHPLLQLPPLHLAIVVAKDSPLLIDCPPAKRGAISSAHSTLDAAIVKLRMAAYMWQAQTAEDFRLHGLERRSFRLEEEWNQDTTIASSLHDPGQASMDSVAKVHIVRSEKTVAELRGTDVNQQNYRVNHAEELGSYVVHALAEHGPPFQSASRPVVAVMILDSHYSVEKEAILAHVAYHASVNNPNREGLSLAVFGSHTLYAWPRFLEEVPSCLLDSTVAGDAVANDSGHCSTMGRTCEYGQADSLRRIKRAFGATDLVILLNWASEFLAQRPDWLSRAPGPKPDPSGLLEILHRDHFRLPSDRRMTSTQLESPVIVRCVVDESGEAAIEAACMAGLARIIFQDARHDTIKELDFCKTEKSHSDENTIPIGPSNWHLSAETLEKEFPSGRMIGLSVFGMNGKAYRTKNLWTILADQPFIKVPGTSLVLSRRSVKTRLVESGARERNWWKWAMLLKRKHRNGGSRLTHASRIDLRVGGTMDGGVVYYADGTRCNCGPADQAHFGGHLSESRSLSEDEVFEITQVSVNRGSIDWGSLDGCSITLSGSETFGALNNGHGQEVQILVCGPEERVIGFYGRSDDENGFAHEFGIITAPRSVVDSADGLPREVYDMTELMNTDGGLQPDAHQASDNSDNDDDNDDDDDDDDDEEDDEDMDN